MRNTYTLLDKSEWKPLPGAKSALGPGAKNYIHQVQPLHLKDTHNTKDTHTLIGVPINAKQSFGNEEINSLIRTFKEAFGLPMLDGSEKQNRRYAWLCLKKFGSREKVEMLIKIAAQDGFWSTKISSFQSLYYKGVQIISKTREGYGQDRSKVAIDASQTG